jgi:ADP-heptose:LPS heptosyltransferase
MYLVSRLLLSISKPGWEMECSAFVPSNYAKFTRDLRQQVKTTIRYLKRRAYMLLIGQASLMRRSITPDAREILWINVTAPSLGDALMDTSGRALLNGRSVSLLTHQKNAGLFEHEPDLEQVWSITPEDLKAASRVQFDLVILDSFSPKSLALKAKVAKSTPFVGLYGFLNAFEVHRIYYSFRRLEKLLGLQPTAQPRLSLRRAGAGVPRSINQPPHVALGIGGEWNFRTYQHWSAVLRELTRLNLHLVLLGSANGIKDAETLVSQFGSSIENQVGKTSLSDLRKTLSSFDLFVGADGGLWHLASACGIPSVALHADCELYDEAGNWRSRAGGYPDCIALHAGQAVSQISPERVIGAVKEMLARLRN